MMQPSDKSVILAKNGAKVIMVKREEREMLCGECLKKIQSRIFIMIEQIILMTYQHNKNINLMKKESYEMMVTKNS